MLRNAIALVLLAAALVFAQDPKPAAPGVKVEQMTKDQKDKVEKLIKEGDDLKKKGKDKEAEAKYNEAIEEADKGIAVDDNPKVKDGGKQKKAKAKYKNRPGACGHTTTNGDVFVGDASMHFGGKPSAGWLRSTKVHEYAHYGQICNRWGDNDDLMQLEAMEAEVQNADKNGLSEAEKKANKDMADKYRKNLSEEEKKKAAAGDYSQPCTIPKGEEIIEKTLSNLQHDSIFIPDDSNFEEHNVFIAPAPGGGWLVTDLPKMAGGLGLATGITYLVTKTNTSGHDSSPNVSSHPTMEKMGTSNSNNTVYRIPDADPQQPLKATSNGEELKNFRLTKEGDYVINNQGKVIDQLEYKTLSGETKVVKTPYAKLDAQFKPVAKTGEALTGEVRYEASEAMMGKTAKMTVTDTSGRFSPVTQEYDVPITGRTGRVSISGKQMSETPGVAKIQTYFGTKEK